VCIFNKQSFVNLILLCLGSEADGQLHQEFGDRSEKRCPGKSWYGFKETTLQEILNLKRRSDKYCSHFSEPDDRFEEAMGQFSKGKTLTFSKIFGSFIITCLEP